jgi:hypothetical protein
MLNRVLMKNRALSLIAAVLATGLVAARAEAQARCRVHEVEVLPADAQIRVGETTHLLPQAYDIGGNVCSVTAWTWSSSNPRAVRVDQAGQVFGVAPGASIIRVATGAGAARRVGEATVSVSAAGPAVVTQTEPPGGRTGVARPSGPGYAAFERQPDGSGAADGLVVEPLQVQLVRGESRALRYYAMRLDGSNAARVPIIFTVEPGSERMVAIDSLGIITALADTGTAIVRAVVPNNQRIQAKLIRVEVRGDEVRFPSASVSLTPGAVETLEVFIPAQERAINPLGIFQFSSSDPAIVRVNPLQPILTAVGPGTTTIRANSSVYPELSVRVSVHRRVHSLELLPADSQLTLAIGGTATLRARALAEDGTPVTEAPITWSAPDTAVLRFDRATGTLRGVRMGNVVIRVSAPVARDTAHVRLVRVRVVPGALAVDRPRIGLPHGGRADVAVTMLDDARQPIGPASDVSWVSDADSVAVMEGSTVVARRPGHARMTGSRFDSTVTVDVYVAGDLLVTMQREGRFDLYQIWPGGVMPLTRDSAIESHATWSPNLQHVAYVRAAPGAVDGELYVMNADGSGARRVAGGGSITNIAWVRPAGQQLIYESGRSGSSQIWIVNADGTGERPVTRGPLPNTNPSISPDGQRMVYTALRETAPGRRVYGIFQMGLDGANEQVVIQLAQGVRVESPQYSSDGQSILFLRDEGTQRNPSRRIYRLRIGAPIDSAVALSPAGSYVLNYSQGGDGQRIIGTIVERQGREEVRRVVMLNVATGTFEPVPGIAPQDRAGFPSLRPAPVAAARR